MVSIARKNLFEDIPRFLVAQAGIMFAVSLVTIQTGILQGFRQSTTLLIDHSKADLWLVSEDFVNLDLTTPLLLRQYQEARKVEGVAIAQPVITSQVLWTVPGEELNSVRIMGFNPDGELFVPGEASQDTIQKLKQPYTIMVEESNVESLHLQKKESPPTIGNLPVSLIGTTHNTQSLVSADLVFTSLETAKAYISAGFSSTVNCQMQDGEIQCETLYKRDKATEESEKTVPPLEAMSAADPIHYILIKAEKNTNLEMLEQRLESSLPGTNAFTKKELITKVQAYWQQRTGLGFILGLGSGVGVIVGVVIVGQILYSSVSDHIKEFGTLKAMGAPNKMIYGVIVEQSLYMAVLGYLPGLLLCWGVSSWAMSTQGILILITPLSIISILGITILMCVGSALFAIQKVTKVDPIIVFKA